MLSSDSATVRRICASFGLAAMPRASITPVSRGARGRIWRLDTGQDRYALKETSWTPDEEAIRREVAVTAHLAATGIRLACILPDASGRFIVPLAGAGAGASGDADADADADVIGWLRLYEWIDGAPADLADPAIAGLIGDLLGRLHAHALPSSGPPDPWYETVPAPDEWDLLAAGARQQGAAWGEELAGRASLLRGLTGLVTPPATAALMTCHQDLHPGNVLVDTAGGLVPLDWDDAGPACPGRELAGVLMFWHGDDDGGADEAAAGRTLRAYRAAGGPGRLGDERSFGAYIAGRLNFLHDQGTLALDHDADPRDQDWASAEVSDTLARLPTLALISRLTGLATAILD